MTLEDATHAVELRKFRDHILSRNVAKGAELLDEVLPGWARAINVRLLSLASPNPNRGSGTGCVLCQLDSYLWQGEVPDSQIPVTDFGHYINGRDFLIEEDGSFDSSEYGFDLYDGDDDEYYPSSIKTTEEYSILDELWKEEIESRL